MDNRSEMLQLCRLCLVKDDVNIPIFEEQGDIRQIFLKISSCLPVKVSREDKLPQKICDGCSYKLDMLYEFWNTTANAEKQLLSWLGEAGMNSKMADGTMSAVAQQIKPVETFVKQEAIDPSDIHTEENDDDKSYMFQDKFTADEAGPSATVTPNAEEEEEEEPPPKRARRTAAVKAQIAMDPESDDDDDDSGEPMTKIEDESEDSEGDDHESSFVDVPSTSADDQPGPSGVGKDGVEAPSPKSNSRKSSIDDEAEEQMLIKYSMRNCLIPLTDVKLDKSLKFFNNTVNLAEGYRYTCHICWKKFHTRKDLMKHKNIHKNDEDRDAMFTVSKKTPKSLSKTTTKKIQNKQSESDSDKSDVTVTATPIHKCKICKVDFKSVKAVKQHPINNCRFICGVCNKTFNTLHAFIVHVLQHKITSKTNTTSDVIFHKCVHCSESFEDYFQLKTHMILVHNKRAAQSTESDMSEHESQLEENNESNELSCELCFDIFSSQEELKDHMEFHKQLNKTDVTAAEEPSVDDADTIETIALLDNVSDVEIVKDKSNEQETDTTVNPIPVIQSSYSLADVENDENCSDQISPLEKKSESRFKTLKSNIYIPMDHYQCNTCDRIYMSMDEFNKHDKDKNCEIIDLCKGCNLAFHNNLELYKHMTTSQCRETKICKYCFETFPSNKKLNDHKLLQHLKFKNLCKICLQCFKTYDEFKKHLEEIHLNL